MGRIQAALAAATIVACLLHSSTHVGHAQSATTGSIRGQVLDRAGRPVAGVRVDATERSTGHSHVLETGRDAHFRIALLPPGEYDVVVERLGYRPRRIEGIPVRPGRRVTLEVTIETAGEPIGGVDSVAFDAGALAGARVGRRWFSALETRALPTATRELTELAHTSTSAAASLAVEGLPSRLTAIVVDGVPAGGIGHPALASDPVRAAAFPLSSLAAAELVTNPIDVEWSGFAGSGLAGLSRPGPVGFAVDAFGAWSGGELASSRALGPAAASPGALRGGILAGGSLLGDSARYVVGVEARRDVPPMWEGWRDGGAFDAVRAVALDSFAVELPLAPGRRIGRMEVASAFGRFDWRVTPDHHLTLRTNAASIPTSRPGSPLDAGPAAWPLVEGAELSTAANLASTISAGWANELRVGFSAGRRSYGGEVSFGSPAPGASPPPTAIGAGGLELHADAAYRGHFERRAVHLTDVLHARIGTQRMKAGISIDRVAYDDRYSPGIAGRFIFADAAALAERVGVFTQTVGPPPVATFAVPRLGFFLQAEWTAAPGLELTAGARYDMEYLPSDVITPDAAWAEMTGLSNDSMPDRVGTLAPRLGFVWDVGRDGRWIVEGAGGVYVGRVDPALLAEAATHDGDLRVRRGVGALGGWPAAPDSAAAPVVGPALTLLAPGLRAPVTTRVGVGLTHRLGARTTLHVGGVYRRTESLPRRRDLNLLLSPAAVGPHGRRVYGDLARPGGLLVAEPGSNRRFGGYDAVWAIDANGESRYFGLTLALERLATERLRVFGRYTFSRTEDDLVGARSGGPAGTGPAFPGGLDGRDWADGRSDFDVPHRAAFGFELRSPLAGTDVRLAGRYRYRSGFPFTPGFRPGVDPNGDGVLGNDPAFIDGSAPGIEALLARWECLADNVDRFAPRNACRGPGAHTLDLRLGAMLPPIGDFATELYVEGIGLIEPDAAGYIDRALHLLDPEGEPATDPAGDAVAFPLAVNPNFGRPLLRRAPGRVLRLGIRMRY